MVVFLGGFGERYMELMDVFLLFTNNSMVMHSKVNGMKVDRSLTS